ncbi:MAG TPA: hypothetical protein VKS78_04575 [Roseiarcus sp.]|nr:hypothetical protein [Roseiarcus sp.]
MADEKKPDHLKSVPLSLKTALRRARVEGAEQSEAIAELREAEIARLEILEEAIRPIVEQTPGDTDLFDVGLAHGERPRLFIDMIGFVEMAHDRRVYRFLQDTRHGRAIIAESERVDRMVAAITNYIARRLVERERALASDWRSREEPAAAAGRVETASAASGGALSKAQPAAIDARKPGRAGEAIRTFLAMIGALALVGAAAYGAWAYWLAHGRALWSLYVGPPPF